MTLLKRMTTRRLVRVIVFSIPSIFVFLYMFSSGRRFDDSAREGINTITADQLRQHIAVLASDSLEGRGTATPGGRKAASYIAGIFQDLGLKPFGENGTYYQRLDFITPSLSTQSRIVIRDRFGSKEFGLERDFYPSYLTEFSITAPVVFVGFSDAVFDSSTLGRMAGKIVLMLSGPRSLASDTTQEAISRKSYVYNFTASSAATLLVCDDADAASYQAIVSKAASYFHRYGGRTRLREDSVINYFKSFYITSRVADAIVRSTGNTLAQLRRKAISDTTPIPVFFDNVSITVDARLDKNSSRTDNVIGLLEGSDPSVRGEMVAFSAHYDHLGKASDGAIYRGADDNGSGSSALLAIARAFVTNPRRPRRSVLFMAFTAEELGLVGSAFFAAHPTIPLDSLSAVIDMDMIGRADNIHEKQPGSDYLYIIGADRVNYELDLLLNRANNESENLSLDYRYDSRKDPNNFFQRSDTWNFAKLNIPVVQLFTGIHRDYHTPRDTPDKILYDKAARIARLAYYTSWKLANTPNQLRPRLAMGNR